MLRSFRLQHRLQMVEAAEGVVGERHPQVVEGEEHRPQHTVLTEQEVVEAGHPHLRVGVRHGQLRVEVEDVHISMA